MADNPSVRAVRLLIADTDTSNQLLPTTALSDLVDLEDGNVKLAAAQALDIIASSEALVSKKITKEGLTTDGPAVAKSLREHAAQLRAQATAADEAADEGYFGIVDVVGGNAFGPELTEQRWF